MNCTETEWNALVAERNALRAKLDEAKGQLERWQTEALNRSLDLDELRAKLAASDTDLAKALVALDNEVAHKTIQRLRAEKAEAKLGASERACFEMRKALDAKSAKKGGDEK